MLNYRIQHAQASGADRTLSMMAEADDRAVPGAKEYFVKGIDNFKYSSEAVVGRPYNVHFGSAAVALTSGVFFGVAMAAANNAPTQVSNLPVQFVELYEPGIVFVSAIPDAALSDSGQVLSLANIQLNVLGSNQVAPLIFDARAASANEAVFSDISPTLSFDPGLINNTIGLLNAELEAVPEASEASGASSPVASEPATFQALDDTAALVEDSAIIITATELLLNDQNTTGAAATIANVSAAQHGVAVLNPDGSVTYTPESNFSGSDSFTYTISSDGLSSTATVLLNVAGVADQPLVTVTDIFGNEDTAIALNINAALADTDASETLSITISGVPSGAVLSAGIHNADDSWTLTQNELTNLSITPAANSNTDFDLNIAVTATENDGSSITNNYTAHVDVAGVAGAPTLAASSGIRG